jgi:hypothetical protein
MIIVRPVPCGIWPLVLFNCMGRKEMRVDKEPFVVVVGLLAVLGLVIFFIILLLQETH